MVEAEARVVERAEEAREETADRGEAHPPLELHPWIAVDAHLVQAPVRGEEPAAQDIARRRAEVVRREDVCGKLAAVRAGLEALYSDRRLAPGCEEEQPVQHRLMAMCRAGTLLVISPLGCPFRASPF